MAFITGNGSLEPLLEGVFAQIHVNLSWRVFGRNRTWDLQITIFLKCRAFHHWAKVTDKSPKILQDPLQMFANITVAIMFQVLFHAVTHTVSLNSTHAATRTIIHFVTHIAMHPYVYTHTHTSHKQSHMWLIYSQRTHHEDNWQFTLFSAYYCMEKRHPKESLRARPLSRIKPAIFQQHTATHPAKHCNTLQDIARHSKTLQDTVQIRPAAFRNNLKTTIHQF